MIPIKRKVVLHGPSTLIISLPSKWAKKYNIEKGSELEVLEEDNNLIISPESRIKSLQVSIDIGGLDRTSIMRVIRSLYRLGYDEVQVNFAKPTTTYRAGEEVSVQSVIHTEVNRLIGYEIIQERGNFCLIKDIQETSSKDFDQVLRRIFLMLIDAFSDLVEAAKTNNQELLKTLEDRHSTITKFVSYCLRMLNKKGYHVPRKTPYYYHIIAYLDSITDIIKYASRDLRNYNKKTDQKVNVILDNVYANLKRYYEIFYKYDNNKVHQINEDRYRLEKALRTLPPGIKQVEVVVASDVFHIMEILLDLIEARTALEY